MPQIMEAGKLSKLIGSIGRQRVRVDNMIQTAAVQCVAQSIVHRNSTPAAQLFDALGKSSRRDALVAYFERFGNLAWSKAENKVIFFDVAALPSKKKLEWTDEYEKQVSAVLWFNTKKEPVIKSEFDVEDAVERLVNTIERNIKKGVAIKGSELFDRVAAAFYGYRADLSNERSEQLKEKTSHLTEEQQKAEQDKLAQREGEAGDAGRTQGAAGKQLLSEAAAAHATPASPEKLAELSEHFGKPQVEIAA